MNETVREWVAKADADYGTALREAAVEGNPNFDVICFLAQQCVEKLMKAVLVDRSAVPPKTQITCGFLRGGPIGVPDRFCEPIS